METIMKPKPLVTTEADRVFWNGVTERKLLISRCRGCSQTSHPRVMCSCNDPQLEWEEAAGTGCVYTFIIYHRSYHPAFPAATPYNVAWVQLKEGPLLLTNIVGCENKDIRIGMPVRVVYAEETNGVVLPKFEPVQDC